MIHFCGNAWCHLWNYLRWTKQRKKHTINAVRLNQIMKQIFSITQVQKMVFIPEWLPGSLLAGLDWRIPAALSSLPRSSGTRLKIRDITVVIMVLMYQTVCRETLSNILFVRSHRKGKLRVFILSLTYGQLRQSTTDLLCDMSQVLQLGLLFSPILTHYFLPQPLVWLEEQ